MSDTVSFSLPIQHYAVNVAPMDGNNPLADQEQALGSNPDIVQSAIQKLKKEASDGNTVATLTSVNSAIGQLAAKKNAAANLPTAYTKEAVYSKPVNKVTEEMIQQIQQAVREIEAENNKVMKEHELMVAQAQVHQNGNVVAEKTVQVIDNLVTSSKTRDEDQDVKELTKLEEYNTQIMKNPPEHYLSELQDIYTGKKQVDPIHAIQIVINAINDPEIKQGLQALIAELTTDPRMTPQQKVTLWNMEMVKMWMKKKNIRNPGYRSETANGQIKLSLDWDKKKDFIYHCPTPLPPSNTGNETFDTYVEKIYKTFFSANWTPEVTGGSSEHPPFDAIESQLGAEFEFLLKPAFTKTQSKKHIVTVTKKGQPVKGAGHLKCYQSSNGEMCTDTFELEQVLYGMIDKADTSAADIKNLQAKNAELNKKIEQLSKLVTVHKTDRQKRGSDISFLNNLVNSMKNALPEQSKRQYGKPFQPRSTWKRISGGGEEPDLMPDLQATLGFQ
jgi:hypothetical protein